MSGQVMIWKPAMVRAILGATKSSAHPHNVEEAPAQNVMARIIWALALRLRPAPNRRRDTLTRRRCAICETVKIPVIAIGGIKEENLLQLRGNGLCGVAVISAIFAQKDIGAATRRLRTLAEEMVGDQE